jgi:hypothetical protein
MKPIAFLSAVVISGRTTVFFQSSAHSYPPSIPFLQLRQPSHQPHFAIYSPSSNLTLRPHSSSTWATITQTLPFPPRMGTRLQNSWCVGRRTAGPIENMFVPCKQRSDLVDETLGNGTMGEAAPTRSSRRLWVTHLRSNEVSAASCGE